MLPGMGEAADYTIRARIVASDATSPGAKSAERRLEDVERKGLGVGSRLMAVFAAVAAGGMVVAGVTRGIVGVNSALEDAKVGLAGMFSANAGLSIADSFKVANKELNTLRKLSAAGAGELADYSSIFQQTFLPLRNAGADLDRINRVVAQTVAVGFATGRGAEGARLLGFDIQQALTAGAGIRATTQLNMVLSGVGMTADQLNDLSSGGRLEVIEKAFLRWQGAVDAFGATWSARYTTFKDNLKTITVNATGPLFHRWSDQLARVNTWLSKNADSLRDIADVWGQRLVKVWDHLIRQAGTYAAIVAASTVATVAPGLGGALRGAGSSAGGFGRSLGAAYGWGSTLPGRSGLMGRVSGGVAGVLGELGASFRGLAPVLGRVAAPLAVLTTAFAAVRGSLAEFPGLTLFVGGQLRGLVRALGGLVEAFGSLTAKGSALNLVGGSLVGTFGGLIWLSTQVVKIVGSLAIGLGVVLQVIGDGLKAIYYAATGQFAEAAKLSVTGRLANANDQLSRLWFPGNEVPTAPGDDGAVPELPGTKTGGNTYIGTVNVKVKSEVNADPARVARAWDEILDKAARNRTQALRNPVMSTG